MSGTFDDPNRESVGLDPIWSGAGEVTEPKTEPEPEPEPEPQAEAPKAKPPTRRGS